MCLSRPIYFSTFAALLASLGCSKVLGEAPRYSFAFNIRVTSDDTSPIEGVAISFAAAQLASTNARGEALVRLLGHEGERRSFSVLCPKEYQSPTQPLLVSLHQTADKAKSFVYTATCVPLRRTAIVAVRMDGGPGLPVHFLDEEVARTDASGAAHFAVKVTPGEPFRVSVATADEDLRPQYPTAELSVGAADDIVLFDQKLTRLKKLSPVVRAKPRRPTRL